LKRSISHLFKDGSFAVIKDKQMCIKVDLAERYSGCIRQRKSVSITNSWGLLKGSWEKMNGEKRSGTGYSNRV